MDATWLLGTMSAAVCSSTLDGTLLDNNYLYVVAWWEAFRERGTTCPAATSTRPSG
jgi:beta-phosphoglucomutase-like phosphatase (HAD superfamily)